MPRPAPGEPPGAVLLNTSGGMVGGDALQVEVRLEAGAAAVAGFAAGACVAAGDALALSVTVSGAPPVPPAYVPMDMPL